MQGSILTESVLFNTCPKCDTINFFDKETSDMFYRARCHHCHSLVEIPEKSEFSTT